MIKTCVVCESGWIIIGEKDDELSNEIMKDLKKKNKNSRSQIND